VGGVGEGGAGLAFLPSREKTNKGDGAAEYKNQWDLKTTRKKKGTLTGQLYSTGSGTGGIYLTALREKGLVGPSSAEGETKKKKKRRGYRPTGGGLSRMRYRLPSAMAVAKSEAIDCKVSSTLASRKRKR